MFKLSIKLLRREYKSAIFYTVAMFIAISMTFVFSSIIFNQSLQSKTVATGGMGWADVNMPVSESVAFVVLFFCCFLIFYVNNYYVLNKSDEIAVLVTSGASTFKAAMCILYQSALLFAIAMVPAIIFGYVSIQVMFKVIADYMHQPVQALSGGTIAATSLMILTILAMLVMVIYGYVHRTEVKDILYSKEDMNVTGVMAKVQLPLIVYLLVYAAGIAMIILPEEMTHLTDFNVQLLLCLVGIIGIIASGIPSTVAKWKKKHMYKHQHFTVSLSNLSYTVLKSKVLMVLLVVAVTVLYYVAICFRSSPKEFVVSLIGYVIVLILMATTIMYNLMIETKERSSLYFNMWKIGYTKKSLSKIVLQEVVMYYAILIVLPLIIMGSIGYRYVQMGIISGTVIMVLLLIFVVVMCVVGVVNYLTYNSTIKSSIVGER